MPPETYKKLSGEKETDKTIPSEQGFAVYFDRMKLMEKGGNYFPVPISGIKQQLSHNLFPIKQHQF